MPHTNPPFVEKVASRSKNGNKQKYKPLSLIFLEQVQAVGRRQPGYFLFRYVKDLCQLLGYIYQITAFISFSA